MDFDNVLSHCGNFGLYQFLVLGCYAYSNMLSSFHYFSQTIISLTPEHWCYSESLDGLSNLEISEIFDHTKVTKPHCTYVTSFSNGSAEFDLTRKCDKWAYDQDGNFESITMELNWVCHDAFKAAIGQSLFFIGACAGTVGFGILADYIGRLPTLLLTCVTGALGDFLTRFSSTLTWFTVCRFISGLSCDTMFYLIYILVFEYVKPEKRTFALNIVTAVFYCLFTCISPWLATLVGTWRNYLNVASLPALLIFLYPVFINESAHWLITKQKYDRAVKCLKNVAKWNKKQVDDEIFENFVKHYKEKVEEMSKLKTNKKFESFFHMFRTSSMRKKSIILILKSMIVTLTFDIISRNMEGLGISPFFLFSISALAYLPGGLTIIFLQNDIGRKGMAFISLLGGGIITMITGYLIAMLNVKENTTVLCVMVVLARYAAIVAYDAEVMYAAELLPTSVRGQGISLIHVAGYGITFLSPYIIYLGKIFKPAPSFLIGLLMIFGAFLCLFLPETLNKKLPETIHDFETFGDNEKICDWEIFKNCFKCVGISKKNKKPSPS